MKVSQTGNSFHALSLSIPPENRKRFLMFSGCIERDK